MSTAPGRPPFPPFTAETAQIKVKAAEDAPNTRDPADERRLASSSWLTDEIPLR